MSEETRHERHARQRRRRRRRVVWGTVVAGAAVAAAAAIAATVLIGTSPSSQDASQEQPSGSSSDGSVAVKAADYRELSADQIAALPEARYDAVIPGLMAYTSADVPEVSRDVYVVSSDTPIYDDAKRPVARFAFMNFAGRPTVIVPVASDGPWTLVMTPARQQLPSQAAGAAPAQTSGWVRTSALRKSTPAPLDRRVVVSAGEQKLLIEDFAGAVLQSFDVAVGAPNTPTPTGVTGYLQERYLDPKQGQTTYPIQLTSLHSSAQDEPFQGEDGGLIGMHYFSSHNGSISHGCIRLSAEAVSAVNELPLGTSVTIVP
ncbi:murein L,D-transpeptidase [Leifsonia sp. ku-ls]|nr:murein L,D-transpeptidase [Leifsonia sp. ku-ls]